MILHIMLGIFFIVLFVIAHRVPTTLEKKFAKVFNIMRQIAVIIYVFGYLTPINNVLTISLGYVILVTLIIVSKISAKK